MDTPLDKNNPPKYCPACASNGLKKRVVKYKDDNAEDDFMCKNENCPWPFNTRKKSKKKKRSREEAEEKNPALPPVSPEHKKQKLSEKTKTKGSTDTTKKPQPPSPPSSSTDIEVAGFMTPTLPSASSTLQADLALSCTPHRVGTTTSDKSDKESSDIIIDSSVSFLGALKTKEQDASPVSAEVNTPKPLLGTINSSEVPEKFNEALASSSPIVKPDSSSSSAILLAECSPGHILDTSSPSYNIPSPGSAFNLVSPKHRRLSMEDEKSLRDDTKSPKEDLEMKTREASKRKMSNNGECSTKVKKPSCAEPFDELLLDYEPEATLGSESEKEDVPDKSGNDDLVSENNELELSSEAGPSGIQPSSGGNDPNFTAMPTKIRPPLRLPKHASQMLSSRASCEPSPEVGPPEVFDEIDDEGNESEEDVMADADDSDSELESLASECSTMSTISDAGSVDSLVDSLGKKKRRGKKKKRKDRRKVHILKCTKTSGVRTSDLSFKDLAQLDNLDTEVQNLQPFTSINAESVKPTESLSKKPIESQPKETQPSQQDNCSPDLTEKMSVSPPIVEGSQMMEIENTPAKISESPMQSSEKEKAIDEKKSLKEDSTSEMVDDGGEVSPDDMDSENSVINLFKHGIPAPLSPMSLTDTDDQSDDARKVGINNGRGKKKLHLPKFRTPAAPVKRVGLKVMLPAIIQEPRKALPENIQEPANSLPENIQEPEPLEDEFLKDSEDLEAEVIDLNEVTSNLAKEGNQIHEADSKEPPFSLSKKDRLAPSSKKDVFKSPCTPTSESSTVSDAHIFLSPAHSMPSPQYSSLPSPSHPHSLPSPGHFSTPSLLSPMPPTPKDDADEDSASRPLKLLLKRDTHNLNADWTSSDQQQQPDKSAGADSDQLKMPGRMRKGGSLDKVVLSLQKSVGGQWQKTLPANKDQTEAEAKTNEEVPTSPNPRTGRKGRNSKETKRFEDMEKSEVIGNTEHEKENECDILPQSKVENKIPKRRGRPPKNKESPSPKLPTSDSENDYVSNPSETASPPELHKKVDTVAGKKTIKLTPCRPPTSLFSMSPRSPRLPPTPASLPPSPQVAGTESSVPEKLVDSSESHPTSSKSSSSKVKAKSGEDDFLANVTKALTEQNTKANDKSKKLNLNADSSLDMSLDQSDDSVSSQEKVPLKTFSRAKQQPVKKEGKPIQNLKGGKGTLTNILSMAAGLDIEANIIEDENTISIAPELLNAWNQASFSQVDPDFDTVKKIGTGLSSDNALVRSTEKNSFLSQFIPNIETEDAGNVILHVSRGDKSTINLPRQEDRTQVKQHNDTKIDLTAASDEIDVHDLRQVSADISKYPGVREIKKRDKKISSASAASMQQEAAEITENLLRANDKTEPSVFGEDWFKWEDWRVDEQFMSTFYSTINKMMFAETNGKARPAPMPGLNPIIQMLYSKKRDRNFRMMDLDKMIRFFSGVGVKYWYCVNTCNYPAKIAIDSLKTNPKISNEEYIKKVKQTYLDHLARSAQPPPPPAILKMLGEKQQPMTDVFASAQVSAIQNPMPKAHLEGQLETPLPPAIQKLARGAPINPPAAHQAGQVTRVGTQTVFQLVRSTEAGGSNPPKAHSGLGVAKGLSPKGGMAITRRLVVPRLQVAPGLFPPASPGNRPINLSKMLSPARSGQGFASPRIFTNTGSPAQPVYHELQVVRPREGQDGRAVIARQAAGLKSPAVPASPKYVAASPRYFAPSPRYENPSTPNVDSPGPMSVQSSNPASVQPMSIKQEYDNIEQTPVNPGSVAISSVLDNNLCSVQMIPSVNPEMRNKRGRIGTGDKCIQFFYENVNDSPAFPPVYVNTTDEVRAVAALVAEKAGDFKRRSGVNRGEIPQYYTEAAKARYILEKVVIKHIEQCFTKKGMREFKVGVKKRNYPKRSTIIKINSSGEKQPADGTTIKVEPLVSEEPELDEDVPSLDLGPPNDAEHMQQIESIVFGNRMPKAKSIKFNSEKATVGDIGKGSKRGGKNKLDYKNPSSPMMMGVVDDLLQRSKSLEAQRTDHGLERAEEEAVDDVDQEEVVDVAVNKPLKVSTSFLRKKRSIGNAVLSPEKSKSKSAKTDDSDGEDMDNILSGSGEKISDNSSSPNVAQNDKETDKECVVVTGGEKMKKAPKEKDDRKKYSSDKESTELTKETEGNDDNLLEQRRRVKCGNMVAFATDVLDEVNDSKEGIKKILDQADNQSTPSKEVDLSQNVRKSYRVKHPNKSWKKMNQEALTNNKEEMDEMVRSVSRGSRPSSQASLSDSRSGSRADEFSRPSSQVSRPSSQAESSPTRRPSLATQVLADHLGQNEEPHPDSSPVLGIKNNKMAPKPTPDTGSADKATKAKFSMEELKKFENSFVREGAKDRVNYLMKKKEKKAKKRRSKYRGFGETSDPKEDEEPKKPKKPKEVKEKVKKVTVEDPVSEVMKHRKDKISQQEKDLMNELLQFASTSDTHTPSTSGTAKNKSPSSASTSQVKEKKIFADFEEAQTLSNDNAIGEDFLGLI